MNYSKKVFQKIKSGNYKITFAESMTGGMLASEFVKNEGSSQFFDKSLVTYSTMSKEDILNVPHGIIERYGIVSKEVSESMVVGLKSKISADIYVSITGNASLKYSPNLACVCFCMGQSSILHEIDIKYNNRSKNLRHVTKIVYKLLYDFLKDK